MAAYLQAFVAVSSLSGSLVSSLYTCHCFQDFVTAPVQALMATELEVFHDFSMEFVGDSGNDMKNEYMYYLVS